MGTFNNANINNKFISSIPNFEVNVKKYKNSSIKPIEVDIDQLIDNSETRKDIFSIEPHSIKTFSEFTDYNNITNEGHYIMYYMKNHTNDFGEITKYNDGTSHVKIGLSFEDMQKKLSGEDSDRLSKFNETLDVSGGDNRSCFTVEEYIYDEKSGFDALLMKDCDGNYRVCYGPTDNEQLGDIFADAFIGIKHFSPTFNLVKYLSGNSDDNVTIVNHQEYQAKTVANYCFNKAESDGVKLSFVGYSLGGALCENGLSSLSNKSNYNDIIDGAILINPVHADLNSKQIQNIKNTNNFKLYVNENDPVHKLFNYDDYKDVQSLFFYRDDMESSHSLTSFANDDYIKYVFNSDGSIKSKTDSGYEAKP